MNKNLVVAIVIVIIIIIGGIFVLQSRNMAPAPQTVQPTITQIVKPTATMEPQNTGTPSATGTMMEDKMMKEADKKITVSNKGFTFNPSTITAKEGDVIELTFKNTGGMHNITIDEFNAATKTIQSGQEDTIQFTANKKGTFEFYCSVGNHRAMGMVGKLIVN